ncbi:hypothetical protein BDP27DRAFT_287661 [Rhodocollybia butyracea]|uniref:Uncharacterized protein n=1 Tax=Rhodocollybia butyracea TaxID=206335 RepID=A0A9P5Q3Z4_9AGAR|nr:hypothetical protein BDP27DRAFT_287661 [Rhodocollybia butyracea]
MGGPVSNSISRRHRSLCNSTVKAERLRDWCNAYPSLSKLIQMMKFGKVFKFKQDTEAETSKLWCDLLPVLDGLLCVQVGKRGRLNNAILQALHAHPTVSKIIVTSLENLPQEVCFDDLSSIIVKSHEPTSEGDTRTFISYLARGLQIEHMFFRELLDNSQIQIPTFKGLQRISLARIPESNTWFPPFISSHSRLKVIEWLCPARFDNIPSSLSTFMDPSQTFQITSVAFRVTSDTSSEPQEWQVLQAGAVSFKT